MNPSRATPAAVAVVLSLSLLAQSGCTTIAIERLQGEPPGDGEIVAIVTTSGRQIPCTRIIVSQDTLLAVFQATPVGKFPVDEVDCVLISRFDVHMTILLVALLAGVAVLSVAPRPPA